MARTLTRDTDRAVMAGVAAGFARYFDVDPVVARLAFVVLAFLHGVGVVLYLICWIMLPKEARAREAAAGSGAGEGPRGGPGEPEPPGAAAGAGGSPAGRFVDEVKNTGERVVEKIRDAENAAGRGQLIGGAILISIGLIFLAPRLDLWFWPHWLNLWDLWPVILIVLGGSMLLRARKGHS